MCQDCDKEAVRTLLGAIAGRDIEVSDEMLDEAAAEFEGMTPLEMAQSTVGDVVEALRRTAGAVEESSKDAKDELVLLTAVMGQLAELGVHFGVTMRAFGFRRQMLIEQRAVQN